MKRRELFAALGVLFVAPAVAKEKDFVESIGGDVPIGIDSKDVPFIERYLHQIGDSQMTVSGTFIWNGEEREFRDIPFRKDKNGYYVGVLPIRALADLANRPADAKLIFDFITNSSFEFQNVAYFDLEEPTVIISGASKTSGDVKILITPTKVTRTIITLRGQQITNDVKTEKVVDFIRTLGYEISGL